MLTFIVIGRTLFVVALIFGIISLTIRILELLWWRWILLIGLLCLLGGSVTRFAVPVFWGIHQHAGSVYEEVVPAQNGWSTGPGSYRPTPTTPVATAQPASEPQTTPESPPPADPQPAATPQPTVAPTPAPRSAVPVWGSNFPTSG